MEGFFLILIIGGILFWLKETWSEGDTNSVISGIIRGLFR